MKISYSKTKSAAEFSIEIGNFFLNISDTKFVSHIKAGSKELFFEGELYYCCKAPNNSLIRKDEQDSFLKSRLANFDAESFINSVEGIYSAVVIDNESKSIIFFCDYLNRKNFFYIESSGSFIASTNLDNLIPELKNVKYNQTALLSYLTIGYTPVYSTFYEGIRRLNNNEYLTIIGDKVRHEFFKENYFIENYDGSYIERYNNLISEGVLSRASSSNFVLNSGGWDSTAIIHLLANEYSSDKINSVVFSMNLKGGNIFNSYELEKVKKISKHYGIKSEIVEVNFSDNSILTDLDNLKNEMKNYHTYFFPDMPKAIAYISNGNEISSVFSGEASDSIHNFGFSQFVSVTYSDKNLREYADKMKSYLYGPTFFKKVLANTYTEDGTYEFFNFYYGKDKFGSSVTDETKIFSYLKSFMFHGGRVPFYKTTESPYASDLLKENFNKDILENIFSGIISAITAENIYYYLLQLYRSYHFHSPQIAVKHTPLRKSGQSCKLPFLDMQMVKFMYSMPENWGRGLELRPAKYPLKYLAKTKWNLPVDILESTLAHSYISELDKKWTYSGGKWNMNCETIYNSVFTDYFKSILSEVSLEKYFSSECFDTKKMQSVVKNFIEGKEETENSAFIYNLGILFSIGLYE